MDDKTLLAIGISSFAAIGFVARRLWQANEVQLQHSLNGDPIPALSDIYPLPHWPRRRTEVETVFTSEIKRFEQDVSSVPDASSVTRIGNAPREPNTNADIRVPLAYAATIAVSISIGAFLVLLLVKSATWEVRGIVPVIIFLLLFVWLFHQRSETIRVETWAGSGVEMTQQAKARGAHGFVRNARPVDDPIAKKQRIMDEFLRAIYAHPQQATDVRSLGKKFPQHYEEMKRLLMQAGLARPRNVRNPNAGWEMIPTTLEEARAGVARHVDWLPD